MLFKDLESQSFVRTFFICKYTYFIKNVLTIIFTNFIQDIYVFGKKMPRTKSGKKITLSQSLNK